MASNGAEPDGDQRGGTHLEILQHRAAAEPVGKLGESVSWFAGIEIGERAKPRGGRIIARFPARSREGGLAFRQRRIADGVHRIGEAVSRPGLLEFQELVRAVQVLVHRGEDEGRLGDGIAEGFGVRGPVEGEVDGFRGRFEASLFCQAVRDRPLDICPMVRGFRMLEKEALIHADRLIVIL